MNRTPLSYNLVDGWDRSRPRPAGFHVDDILSEINVLNAYWNWDADTKYEYALKFLFLYDERKEGPLVGFLLVNGFYHE